MTDKDRADLITRVGEFINNPTGVNREGTHIPLPEGRVRAFHQLVHDLATAAFPDDYDQRSRIQMAFQDSMEGSLYAIVDHRQPRDYSDHELQLEWLSRQTKEVSAAQSVVGMMTNVVAHITNDVARRVAKEDDLKRKYRGIDAFIEADNLVAARDAINDLMDEISPPKANTEWRQIPSELQDRIDAYGIKLPEAEAKDLVEEFHKVIDPVEQKLGGPDAEDILLKAREAMFKIRFQFGRRPLNECTRRYNDYAKTHRALVHLNNRKDSTS